MGPLETCSDQAMKTIFDVNLFGAIRTIRAFLPAMKRRRAGRIIVSSSIGGLQGEAPGRLWHGELGKSPNAHSATLPQGCPSTLCTVPASSQWRGCVRAWPSSCAPSTSSQCPWGRGDRAPALRAQGWQCQGRGRWWLSCHSAASRSLTLVECGPVNSSFTANLQRPDPDGSELQRLDAGTRSLYRRFLQHCQGLFRDAAQEVDEVLQVSPQGVGGGRRATVGWV